MLQIKKLKKNVLPVLLSGMLVISLIISCIPVLDAQSFESTVKQSSGETAEEFQNFLNDNVQNNLLAEITPTAVEELENGGTFNLSVYNPYSSSTDGDYNTYIAAFLTGLGIAKYRFTYTLSAESEISDVVVVCRENNAGDYGFDYEIYISDQLSNLYTAENLVFVKNGDEYSEGGQWITFDGSGRPSGKYVGFRITDYIGKQSGNEYRYHISELGIYGVESKPDMTVKQTDSNSVEVLEFISKNIEKNLIKGFVPSITEEGTSNEVNVTTDGWDTLGDGDYATRKSVFPTGRGNGVLRYTYMLPSNTKISDFLVVCRENNPGMYGLDYEIYVGSSTETLYNSENLVFKKDSQNYTEGGQLISLPEELRPEGRYVGFRFIDSVNKYHLGELGVYGEEVQSADEADYNVKQTDSDSAEFVDFLNQNKDRNVTIGITPSVIEENTSMTVNVPEGGWESLSDGDYNTSKIIFPTGLGNGVLRYTYALPYCMEISNLLVVCRENNTGTFALEYEIYVASMVEDLYNEENLVFKKTATNYTEGGQLVFFEEGERPEGYFVGLRLINSPNKYHLSEFGIYGKQIEDTVPYITQHTLTDLPAIQEQIKQNNLLRGITPTLYDCMVPEMPWKKELDNSAACNWIGCNGDWDLLTDGELFMTTLESKRRVDIMQGKKQGGLVLTYELNDAVLVDKIVMIGMWAGFGDYCTQEYKLYISDSLDDLYDGSNLILTYNNEDRYDPSQQYSGAGQMFTFNNKPSGKYFGIKFTDENNTDTMIRLEEIGIFGSVIEDSEVNVLDNKLCDIYLSDDEGTKLSNELISAPDRILLANGSCDDEVSVESSGKNVEFVYDLCKEMTLKGASITTSGDSVIRNYTVYAADFAENIYDESSVIGRFSGESNPSAKVLFETAVKARYIRIIIDSYSGTHLELSEIEITGSLLDNPKIKNIVMDIDESNISAWISSDGNREKDALINKGESLKTLVDGNRDTSVQIYGAEEGETIDILFKLPNLKLIQSFEYIAGSDVLPESVSYYIGETEDAVFDKSAVPVASQSFFEDDDEAQPVVCVPAVGLYVRVSVTASEQASDETSAATIAQLRVNGFYVEGFLDASGDKTVLKSFEDESTGISVKISKLYSNDIWSKIVRMEINKRSASANEKAALTELGLKVYDSVIDICFYDSENNRITDLGGREMTVTMEIPEEEAVAYMAQGDGESLWINNASYDGNKIFYTLLPDEITYLFALAVEDIIPVENNPVEELPPVTDEIPDVNLPVTDSLPDVPEQPANDSEAETEQWISKIGSGKLTEPVIGKIISEVHPAVWYALIGAAALELIAAVIFIVLRVSRKNKK